MLLQSMIFPDICKNQELYFKYNNCKIDNKVVAFSSLDSMMDLSCYFNMFSYEKWSKYTNCGSIGMQIRVTGSVELIVKHIYLDNLGVNVDELNHHSLAAENSTILTIPFPKIDKGFYSVAFKYPQPDTTIEDIAYVSVDRDYYERDITLGLCICTYHREQEILNNITYIRKNILENPRSRLYEKIQLFISDNASSLKEEDSQYIHIFHNKNYGGSGGFSRAVIEALKTDVTHMILMDDDISFEIEMIERTYIFLAMLKDEYKNAFLGAAMLMNNNPTIQHAAGETDDLNGIHFDKRYFDLSKLNMIVMNEKETGSNYLGWWYCAIPRETFEEKGLSYPMFVQYDDIEFSIRNSECPKITVSGLAVWHEDFEKKKSAVKTYYTIRNRLISHSICYGRIKTNRRFVECLMKSIGRVRRGFYNEAVLVLKAVDDFLKGPEYIGSLDLTIFNKELYEYANSLNEKRGFLAGLVILSRNISTYVRLILNARKISKEYQSSLHKYTNKRFWVEKLR
ncbi:MAG: hypothetical protein MJZ11_09985 [Lachnospiraceae bacterium]|nr:hypothetical protein [Lachnospiraceae bacterium]